MRFLNPAVSPLMFRGLMTSFSGKNLCRYFSSAFVRVQVQSRDHVAGNKHAGRQGRIWGQAERPTKRVFAHYDQTSPGRRQRTERRGSRLNRGRWIQFNKKKKNQCIIKKKMKNDVRKLFIPKTCFKFSQIVLLCHKYDMCNAFNK